jgi:hypothetical protein
VVVLAVLRLEPLPALPSARGAPPSAAWWAASLDYSAAAVTMSAPDNYLRRK